MKNYHNPNDLIRHLDYVEVDDTPPYTILFVEIGQKAYTLNADWVPQEKKNGLHSV